MKKKFNYFLIITMFIFIVICFNKYQIINKSVITTSQLFINKVFPFLFIMMIINNILIKINFPYYLNKVFHNKYLYIFIMSVLSGSPINAIIINDYLKNNYLTHLDASITLSFTTLNNPLFLYNYFKLIFNNNLIIIKLFIIIYLGNIIIFIIASKYLNNSIIKLKYQNIKFSTIFTESIRNSILNLLYIFAFIIFFKLVTDLCLINNTLLSILLKGLLEITQGLNNILLVNCNLKIKEILCLVILSFSGLSIHMQIANILKNYNINYKYFYLSRIGLIIFSILSLTFI